MAPLGFHLDSSFHNEADEDGDDDEEVDDVDDRGSGSGGNDEQVDAEDVTRGRMRRGGVGGDKKEKNSAKSTPALE